MKTTKEDASRKKYSPSIISSIPKTKFKTKLEDSRLESRMASKKKNWEDAFSCLSSIGQIMDEMTEDAQRDVAMKKVAVVAENTKEQDIGISDDNAGPAVNASDNASDLNAQRDSVSAETNERLLRESRQELLRVADDDANRLSSGELHSPATEPKDAEITKRLGYNRYMIDNVWKVGRERIRKENVREKRASAAVRADRKVLIKRAVINQSKLDPVSAELKDEKAVDMPPWTTFLINKFPGEYC